MNSKTFDIYLTFILYFYIYVCIISFLVGALIQWIFYIHFGVSFYVMVLFMEIWLFFSNLIATFYVYDAKKKL